MKKLLLILLCLPLLFSTCKKDDDNSPVNTNNTSASIIGLWELKQYEIVVDSGYYTNYPNGQIIVQHNTENIIMGNTVGAADSLFHEFMSNGTWKLDAYHDNSHEGGLGNWVKNGNLISIDYLNMSFQYTITTLSTTDLIYPSTILDTTHISGTIYFQQSEINSYFKRR